jgi:thiosulfate/3-mercaptopyruvate sulfurtransferase
MPRPAWVDSNYVLSHLDHANVIIVDARTPERFHGIGETMDPVGGHIPGAVNHFYRNNLGDDGRFRSRAALREAFANTLGGRSPESVVHQCGSGVTACHNLLAMEVAGLHGSRLYPGSWSEWCADPARPVSRD